MDSNNPNRPGAKFDPITGQPVPNGDNGDAASSAPPPSDSTTSSYTPASYPASEATAPDQGFRVATGGPTSGPMPPPASETAPYSYTPQGTPPPTMPQPQYAPPPQQVNFTQPKKGSNLPLILGALAVLLIAGAVGTYFLLNRAGVVGGTNAAIERALPANTIGYFQVDPNPSESQKRAFDNMRAAFEAQPGFNEAIERMTKDANAVVNDNECFPSPEGQGLNALDSYLGDSLTIAVLAPSADDLNTIKAATQDGEPGQVTEVAGRNIVGLVDLDFNPLNKKGPLAEIKNIADNKTQSVEVYDGVDIRRYQCKDVTLYFGTLSGTNTAVVGSDIAPLKRIIDEYKKNTGLKDDNTFKFLSGKVPSDRVATIYMNLTEIFRYAEVMSPETFSTGQIPKGTGAIMMTLSGQDDGLQFDVASEATFDNLGYNFPTTNAKPDASTLTDIPADSLAFFAGTDLKSIINTSLDALEKQNPGSIADVERQVQEATSLDLRDDIISWMGGDYALSVSRGDTNASGSPNPPMMFQLKLNGDDRAKATDALAKIMASTAGGNPPPTFEAAGGTFYDLGGMAVVGVGTDRLIVVGMPFAMFMGMSGGEASPPDVKGMLDTYTGAFGQGLGTTDKWKDASRHLPADSNSIVYMDATSAREMAEASMEGSDKESYEESTAPFIRPFKYVLIGTSNDPIRENEPMRGLFRLFIGISK